MLHRLIRHSHIFAACMSPAFNGSSVLQCFECGNMVEICNGIMFHFYPGLPHIVGKLEQRSHNHSQIGNPPPESSLVIKV